MKKITYLLIAAIATLSVASCVKELSPEPALVGCAGQEFTVSLPATTRTDLVEGKTVWAKGDSLWVSNGAASESVVVPEEAWGKKEFTFVAKEVYITEESPKLYLVYPYSAAAGLTDGKLAVRIPSVQSGLFADANIAAAVTESYTIALKNVTSVLKITVPDETQAPIYSLSISASNDNALTGTCTVDLSGDTPALTPTTSSSNASVQVDAFSGDFYVSVIPGTFDAGFKVTAATTDFAFASETKETKVANTLQVNDLVDLGIIGANLQPLQGDGSESNPYLIESLGHMIALSSAVNDDITFEGKYLKVANDISGITAPIGSYADDSNYFPFQGDFDGGGHTLTLAIDGADQSSNIRLGLFSALTDGANIHDLTVDGTLTSKGATLGGVAGRIDQSVGEVKITNVTSKVKINANVDYVGGIVGYVTCKVANMVSIKNCTNEGSVTGRNYVGGIAGASASNAFAKIVDGCQNKGTINGSQNVGGLTGFGYYFTHTNCTNIGEVTSTGSSGGVYMVANGKFQLWPEGTSGTIGTGGIIGLAQNCTITDNTNSGNITGLGKVGGIAGTTYWSSPARCSNSGTIKATQTNSGWIVTNMGMAGGIVGQQYVAGNISSCTNSGAITGTGALGGIVGYQANGSTSNTIRLTVADCINEGTVTGNGQGVGGISGVASSISTTRFAVIRNCVNKGKVTNASSEAGGIVGCLYDMNNGKYGIVVSCTNEADVQGTLWVGGIVGYALSRATGGSFTVSNCENYGKVLATRADADSGEVTGGIVGAINGTTATTSPTGLFVSNCVNYGPVQYREATHVNPYVGGIVGRLQYGRIDNCANHGPVGPETGEALEDANKYLGAIVGRIENTAVLANAYSLTGVAAQAAGLASVDISEMLDVISYDADGLFVQSSVTDEVTVDAALNRWVVAHPQIAGGNGNDSQKFAVYPWNWDGKPVFVKE